MFHIGQKVVCINAHYTNAHYSDEIFEDEIYTIRWIGIWAAPMGHPIANENEALCVRLVGLVRPDLLVDDVPFSAARFRPLVERKTDISIFTQILDDATTRIPEHVR